MENNQNFKFIALAIVLSIIIFLVWDSVFLAPMRKESQTTEASITTNSNSGKSMFSFLTPKNSVVNNTEYQQSSNEVKLLKNITRLKIQTPLLTGSINLKGALIDSAILTNYKETIKSDSPNIVLLHPQNTQQTYFYSSGFVTDNHKIKLPNEDTLWQTNSKQLTPNHPIELTYVNPQGIIFKKLISIDSSYMLEITDKVINNTSKSIEIYPWALIFKHGEPITQDTVISHEGVVGFLNGELEQVKYKEIKKKSLINYTNHNNFVGFANKYFMVALIPNNNPTVSLRYFTSNQQPNYQVDYIGDGTRIATKQSLSNTTKLFVGPKAYNLLHQYGKQYNIPKFEDSIDFGWFYFITKPFLRVLLFFYHHIGNFGYAMLCFTILIRLFVFPITYMSFASMAKMRKIQPKLKDLKAKYASDKAKLNQATMELYRKHKVNPLAGCLPLLLQIPILFSIYKVIYISIEMRHANFWWIKDLSAPDPTSIFNLFGLLPYNLPDSLNIGMWAILMGITMYIQQKLSGTSAINDAQQKIMKWFPVFMIIILAHFPVGLLIYWCWSNIISIVQQWVINKIVAHRHA